MLREEAQAGPPGDARGPGWGELEDQLAGLVAGARGAHHRAGPCAAAMLRHSAARSALKKTTSVVK